MTKIFCDFCKGELSESDENRELRDSQVFHNEFLNIGIEVTRKDGGPDPDMCSKCLFEFIEMFDPRGGK
jgi:hypothetical protein